MDFTLKQLEIFIAVVDNGSALAASRCLGISQPAVSSALSDLEANLGSELFVRWKKRIALNEKGRELTPLARLLLANARSLQTMFGLGQMGGALCLGASRTLSSYIIPRVLSDFAAQYPHVKLELVGGNKESIISGVENFSLDIGVIAGRCNRPYIDSLPWRNDELCVIAGPDHPLARRDQISKADLAGCGWVVREEGSGTREVFLKALPSELRSINIVMKCDNLEAIKRFVERSRAIGCVSRHAVDRELEAGLLKLLPTPFLDLRREYFFLVHQQRRQTPLLNTLITFCLSQPDALANQL